MLCRFFGINHNVADKSRDKGPDSLFTSLFDKKSCGCLNRILLCGPPSSGKSSLLFELALSFAEEEKYVLYICPKKITKLPLLAHGKSHPTSGTLKYIQMMYLESRGDFLNYMASIHFATNKRFSSIIVDDMDAYFTTTMKNEDLSLIARVFALAVDAFQFQVSKLKQDTDASCGMLVMSITTPSGTTSIPRQQFYERWVNCFLHSQEKEPELFEMLLLPSNCRTHVSLANVTYRITDQTIAVQNIEYCSQSVNTG